MFNGNQPRPDTTKLYSSLNVSKDATLSDIKKAYRNLAMKTHPDRGGDPEKFKEIAKAYEVLSDPDKRALYNAYGEEGLKPGASYGGFRQQGKRRTENIVFALKVSLASVYTGCSKSFWVTRNVLCKTCEGNGGLGNQTACTVCHASGVCFVNRQIGPNMVQQIHVTCTGCHGKKYTYAKRCGTCSGKRVVDSKSVIKLEITKGMMDNRMGFPGYANEMADHITGDLVINVEVQDEPGFQRFGADIIWNQNITLAEALSGFRTSMKHLDGTVLMLTSKPGMVYSPGMMEMIYGKGMSITGGDERGDLFIIYDVEFPVTLTHKTMLSIKALLPTTPKQNIAGSIEAVTSFVPDLRKKALFKEDKNESRMDNDCRTQ